NNRSSSDSTVSGGWMSSALSDIPSKITYMARALRTVIAAFSLVVGVGVLQIRDGASLSAQQQPPAQQPPGQQPPAQQPPAQQPPPAGDPSQQTGQPPTFRTGINFVRVDVIITDRNGNSVGDLQVGDFDVTEDGKSQKIETFRLVKLD